MTLPPFMTAASRTALPSIPELNVEELEQSAVKTLARLEQRGLSATETLASIDNVVIMLMDSRNVSPAPEAVAADIVDVSLEDFPMMVSPKAAMVTPPPSPTNTPRDGVHTAAGTLRSTSKTSKSKSSRLPTKNDPEDPTFRTTLHSDGDKGKINSAHVTIRREVLEVRRVASGRIYLQCTYCQHLDPNKRARCSTVAPESVEGLYRAMVRFRMNHIEACDHIPLWIKAMCPKKSFNKNKADKHGIKAHWIESANAMGLFNGDHEIIYCPEAAY